MKILSPLIIAGLLIINLYYCNFAFAINVSEAINLAIANNIEIQIERKKTDYSTFLQYETITDFLPNASLNYRDGTRTTAINSIHNKQKDRVTTLNISQPLFSGFSGLAKYRQSVYQNKSAKENLKLKKFAQQKSIPICSVNRASLYQITKLLQEAYTYAAAIIEDAKDFIYKGAILLKEKRVLTAEELIELLDAKYNDILHL
jgi:outer membrane protein TolC